jgi:hypothetical protein
VSRLTEAQAALDMLVNEAGGQPPTGAELAAIPDAPAVVDAALKRMAQLEKVADAARPVVDPSALSPALLTRMGGLASALAELDRETTP